MYFPVRFHDPGQKRFHSRNGPVFGRLFHPSSLSRRHFSKLSIDALFLGHVPFAELLFMPLNVQQVRIVVCELGHKTVQI